MKSLQYQFIDSKGSAVKVDGKFVIQMDRIPIEKGTIKITFLKRTPDVLQGVALKSRKGKILLSDAQPTNLLHIWDREDLPKVVTHEVICPDGELRIWNFYKVKGSVSDSDAWTNNAGMIVEDISSNRRKYTCSDGIGDFNAEDFTFEVEWNHFGLFNGADGIDSGC